MSIENFYLRVNCPLFGGQFTVYAKLQKAQSIVKTAEEKCKAGKYSAEVLENITSRAWKAFVGFAQIAARR